jgi:hypothetical protein
MGEAVVEGRRSRVAALFTEFGDDMPPDRLPLYRALCHGTATDPELVALMDDTPEAQLRPNLLLAAVHHLLLGGLDHPLGAWYGTIVDEPRPVDDGDPMVAWRDLCLSHRDELAPLLATRATQTNEVGRCTATMPAVADVEAAADRPIGLVEVGASAGLNLLLDRWAYRYGPDGEVAPPGGSDLTLTVTSSGPVPVPVPAALPTIVRRVGLDLAPVDITDESQARWLVACLWPEQPRRVAQLRRAIAVARRDPPELVVGDAVDDLAPLVRSVPVDAVAVVVTTWAAAYLADERQRDLLAVLDGLGADRDLSYVFAERPVEVPGLPVPPRPDGVDHPGPTALVRLDWRDGRRHATRLADMHPHGKWLAWVA